MKICPRSLALVVLATFGGWAFAADWQPVSTGLPLTIAGVNTLTVDPKKPETMYATTANRSLYKTIDGGANWTSISAVTDFNSFLMDPENSSILYAATSRSLLKSLDGGATWGPAGPTPQTSIYALAAGPAAPHTIYAVGTDGLLRSTDGAETWTRIPVEAHTSAMGVVFAGEVLVFSHTLAVDPKNSSVLYASLYIRGTAGLYSSGDGGASWFPVQGLPSGTPEAFETYAVFDSLNPSTIYAASNLVQTREKGARMAKSTDNGRTWTAIAGGFPSHSWFSSLVVDPFLPSTVYASYTGDDGWGVIKSTDGGQTFQKLDSGLPPYDTFAVIAISPTSPPTVYTGYSDRNMRRGRLVKSRDGGSTWSDADRGLALFDLRALAVDSTNPSTAYAGVGGGEGVFKTVDAGAHWSLQAELRVGGPQPGPAAVNSLSIPQANPNVLYASTSRAGGWCIYTDKLFFKTTDAGANWDNIANGLNGGCGFFFSPSVMVLDPVDPDDLYLGGGGDCGGAWLTKSVDGGASWNHLSDGFADTLFALAIDPSNPSVLYIAAPTGVLKSTNGGVSWKRTGLEESVATVAIDPANPDTLYAATGGWYGRARSMFKSVDAGMTWVSINTGLDEVIAQRSPVTALLVAPNHAVYAATSGSGVYKSTDGGANWAPFNRGLGSLDVRVLTVSAKAPHRLYAATSGGVFTLLDEESKQRRGRAK